MTSVVVQQLTITWSKQLRGAPAAVARNALPRALPIICYSKAYLYQHHVFDCFTTKHEHRLLEDQAADSVPRMCRDVSLTFHEGVLSTRMFWNPYMGQPHRTSSRTISLRPGETARLLANGRKTDGEGFQFYTREIYNIALTQHPRDDLFAAVEPVAIVSFEADLF